MYLHNIRKIGVALTLLLVAASTIFARDVVDMTERRLTIPDKIEKVYCTSPVGSILIYTLAPEKLAGWNYDPTPEERKFIAPPYNTLPTLGGWFGKSGTGNLETIVAAHPDIILSVGTTDTLSIELSERLQKQSGIPVIMVGSGLTELDRTYRFVGDLLGAEAHAEVLASYCRTTIDEAKAVVATIPKDKRPRVYYAEGPKGLETDPSGSFHTEVLDLLGAKNVAQVKNLTGYGRAEVSLEQLLVWKPEIVIAGWENGGGPGEFFARVRKNPAWNAIPAIQNGRVYETPQYPFNWFDRPPSVNRLIGVKWMENLLYPDVFPMDLRKEVRNFYAEFYHVQLSENDLTALLAHAVPTK
jgi:iron complex transport system substrate-binding protein